MIQKSLKYVWGIVSIGIYFVVVGVFLFYFNYRHMEEKKRYVKKDEHRIQITLSSPRENTILNKKEHKLKPKK
ncbi:MAG: hypothetical protein LGB62_05245, partial [Sulfurovum sp.]|nr:hypothetical protein [Sulfurovum sp.]MCB4780599.1 hypothetical protein [Sulfurovum sp.]